MINLVEVIINNIVKVIVIDPTAAFFIFVWNFRFVFLIVFLLLQEFIQLSFLFLLLLFSLFFFAILLLLESLLLLFLLFLQF